MHILNFDIVIVYLVNYFKEIFKDVNKRYLFWLHLKYYLNVRH